MGSGVISPLMCAISIVTLLLTLLITTHEPPTIGGCLNCLKRQQQSQIPTVSPKTMKSKVLESCSAFIGPKPTVHDSYWPLRDPEAQKPGQSRGTPSQGT